MLNKLSKILIFSLFLLLSLLLEGAETLRVGNSAPSFVLKDMNNNNIFLRDYCGKLRKKGSNPNVVILSFFATWCKPCHKEIPILQKFYNDFKEESIQIFLIDIGEKKEKVQSFVYAKNITLHVLLDSFATTAKNYGVADYLGRATLPQLFIIDTKGKIVYIKKGYKKSDNLRKVLIEQVSRILN